MVIFQAQAGLAALHRLHGRDDAAVAAATEALELYRADGFRRFRNRIDPHDRPAGRRRGVLRGARRDRRRTGRAGTRGDAARAGRPPAGRVGRRRSRRSSTTTSTRARATAALAGRPRPRAPDPGTFSRRARPADQRAPGWCWSSPQAGGAQSQEDPVSAFLYRLGRSSARHPFRVLGLWLVAAVAVMALQGSAGGEFDNSERVPGVESQHAADVLNDRFPSQGGLSARIVLHTDDGRLDDADHAADRRAGPRAARRRARTSPASPTRSPPEAAAVSADGQTAYLDVTYALDKLTATQLDDAMAVTDDAGADGVQVELTGSLALLAQEDPSSELIGVGVAIIVLLVAFGSVVAMGLPIVTALHRHLRRRRRRRRAVRLHGRPGVLADPLRHDRPRRGHRLRAVHRHPPPPAPPRRHERRGRRRHRQRHRRPGRAVRRHHRRHRHPRPVPRRPPGHQRHGRRRGPGGDRLDGGRRHAAPRPARPGRHEDRQAVDPPQDPRRQARRRDRSSGRWAHHVGSHPVRYAIVGLGALCAIAVPALSMRIGVPDDGNAPADTTQRIAYDQLADGLRPRLQRPDPGRRRAPDAGRPGGRRPRPRRAAGRPRRSPP